ncbi:MAG: hypothetical protein M3Z66_03015 [Chloroflexota bacterium]|nr:hypothetical protein [Chloroflexota bacterium]
MADDTGDKIIGKAQDAVGKFMDDPDKVARTKSKVEGVLAKRMDPEQASQLVDKAEELLDRFAQRRQG